MSRISEDEMEDIHLNNKYHFQLPLLHRWVFGIIVISLVAFLVPNHPEVLIERWNFALLGILPWLFTNAYKYLGWHGSHTFTYFLVLPMPIFLAIVETPWMLISLPVIGFPITQMFRGILMHFPIFWPRYAPIALLLLMIISLVLEFI